KRAWHGYESILGRSETVGRVAQYRAAFRKAKNKLGYDDYNAMLYAGFKARDIMDFAVMGYQMQWINRLIPFSNAAVQGIRSSVRFAQENPAKFAARMLIYTVLPSAFLWGLNHRNKEESDWYESLPDYQRDLAWNFRVNGVHVAIPKPYELGMFSSGVDRSLSKGFGYNDRAFDGYAGQIMEAISPVG